jgi:hypothetical protein
MLIREEMAAAEFGDERLRKRLVRLVERVVTKPDASFPMLAPDDAALEATYRFFGNAEVTPERILKPHLQATKSRATAIGEVIVAHDTTELEYRGDRAEMGWLDRRTSGFLAHFALAVSHDDAFHPLGILGLRTVFRYGLPSDRSQRRKRRLSAESEERRWWQLVQDVEAHLGGEADAIHVMDREADSYTLLWQLVSTGTRFVIRMAFDRRTAESSHPKISEVLERAPVMLTREVKLAARREARRSHPQRSRRTAKLAVSGSILELRKPDWADPAAPASLKVSVVRVYEIETPYGHEPIEWKLVTTEAIATAIDVAKIVDAYRARWRIEEYFKALKSGCSIEKRQLGSKRALLNALALFAPIAWHLLVLRSVAREAPSRPATDVLSPKRVRLLQRHPKSRLKQRPTVRDAMLAVSRLAGHLERNGDPGWQLLGRGLEILLVLEEGARIGRDL